MDVSYDDLKLERTLADKSKMIREFGSQRASKLVIRLSTLRAVEAVVDLFILLGRWHTLSGDWEGHLSADLDQPYRLIARPTEPVARNGDGGVDWARTTAVTVVSIVDYH